MQEQNQVSHSLFQSGFAGDDLALQKRQEITKPDVSQLINDLEETSGTINLIHGANEDKLPLVNHSVGKIREELHGLYNLAPNAVPLVDGLEVSEDYIMSRDESLEFMKTTGRKGR